MRLHVRFDEYAILIAKRHALPASTISLLTVVLARAGQTGDGADGTALAKQVEDMGAGLLVELVHEWILAADPLLCQA